MTRGTGYLVTEKQIYYHDEFNGDMYPDGNGRGFLRMMNNTTPETFTKKVKAWNKRHHNYEDFKTHDMPLKEFKPFWKFDKLIALDFNKKYYDWFFSDWVFIKNGTEKIIKVKTMKSTTFDMEILPNETRAFSFGQEDESYSLTNNC